MKKSETENDVTELPRGMDSNTENSHTENTAPIVTIQPMGLFGVVASVTASTTPARSLPLSEDEHKRLWRIARDRANRFMVSAPDVDFLLEVIVRMSR